MTAASGAGGHPPPSISYPALLARRRTELAEELERIALKAGPLVWEVGSGHGHFLTAYATAHPEKICIGIDLASDRIARAHRKRDRAKLPHLHFIRAEARFFLDVLPPAVRFDTVFVLFPDPWPKLRHHKHRILQPEFLAATAARAKPGCRLYFRTDHRPYFEDARKAVSESANWQLVDEPWLFEFVTVFQSRAPVHHSLVARRG